MEKTAYKSIENAKIYLIDEHPLFMFSKIEDKSGTVKQGRMLKMYFFTSFSFIEKENWRKTEDRVP